MTHPQIYAVEQAGRTSRARVALRQDGDFQYAALLTALLPAAAILFAAAIVMSRLLAA